jgi:RNA polymerase sigma factor for flagellar operon FliA
VDGTTVSKQAGQAVAGDEPQLWARWRDGRDLVAREALIARHLPYARTVAATYYGRRMHDEIEFGDYLQYARIGLLEALDRFDPGVGVMFRTFAARRMHGAILDGIERLTEKQQQIAVRQRLRRDRLHDLKDNTGPDGRDAPARRDGDGLFRYLADVGIGLAICQLLEGTGMVDNTAGVDTASSDRHYEPVEMAQLQRRLLGLVDQLSAQQRTVIRYHYLQDHSFEDIAKLMSVTRGRISQIHRQALGALRVQLAADATCDVSW